MPRKGLVTAGFLALSASLCPAATDLVPQRVADVSRQVEEVRGRRFERPVPATEIDPAEARRILRGKIVESLPASAEEYLRSLKVLGLIDESPGTLDRLVDFYASQVVAFYDPEPRRFFVVKGAENLVAGGAEMAGLAQGLIYSHELMHALQDETLRLDARTKALKDDGDRAFALQCLLEGEATFVMIKVALKDIPGADEKAEEELAPLLTAGGLEKANVPKDVPDYFVEQLFFPYAAGTSFVREAYQKGGWPEVDRLWRNPPESSAEILHGRPYPPPATGLLPSNAASLFPGGRLVYTDTLGEWTVKFLLGRALPDEEAERASEGWRGDRVAFGVANGKMGYFWRVRFDDPDAAARFEATLKKARSVKPTGSAETIKREGRDVVVTSPEGLLLEARPEPTLIPPSRPVPSRSSGPVQEAA